MMKAILPAAIGMGLVSGFTTQTLLCLILMAICNLPDALNKPSTIQYPQVIHPMKPKDGKSYWPAVVLGCIGGVLLIALMG